MFRKIEAWILYLIVFLMLCFSLIIGFVSYWLEHPRFSFISPILTPIYELPYDFYNNYIERRETPLAIMPDIDHEIHFLNINHPDLSNYPFTTYFKEGDNNFVNGYETNLPNNIFYNNPDLGLSYGFENNPNSDSYFAISQNAYIQKDSNSAKLKTLFVDNFHHQINIDEKGQMLVALNFDSDPNNIYTRMQSNFVNVDYHGMPYNEQGFAIIKIDGSSETYNLMEMLKKNDLEYLIYRSGLEADPFHINSVFKAERDYSDTPILKGDILLSLRHQSLLIVVRPSTNEVVWYKSGPWLNQHDASFTEDGDILVFDNNVVSSHARRVDEVPLFRDKFENRILIYSFANNDVYEIGKKCKTEGVYTVTGGSVSKILNFLAISYENQGIVTFCDMNTGKKDLLAIEKDGYIDRESNLPMSLNDNVIYE